MALVFLVEMKMPGSEESGIEDLERLSHVIGWASAADSDLIAREIASRVNDERVARGLRPLAWHEGLASTARAWSEEMISTSYRHSPDAFRAHPDFLGTGENIAMGQTNSQELHVGWMESHGHRQNILLPEFTAIGVGVVCRNDGRMWATQVFGMASGVSLSAAKKPPPIEPIVRRDRGVRC